MTLKPPDDWNWLFHAGDERLFEPGWLANPQADSDYPNLLHGALSLHAIPTFDWMEQRLIGYAGSRVFRGRLDTLMAVWDSMKPPILQRAATRMLVRLLRRPTLLPDDRECVQRVLDTRLRGSNPLGIPEIRLGSAKEVQEFIDWEGKYGVGRHRLLFPVYTDSEAPSPFLGGPSPFQKGALVAATVSLVEYQNPPDSVGDRPFVLAPWSWFEWTDKSSKDEDTFEKMTKRLHDALSVTGALAKQDSAGKVKNGRQVFVIDLQLISPLSDFAPAGRTKEDLQAWAWSSGPFYDSINGPSLSLTLAFSAWAVTQHLAVRPLIATGKVLEDSTIRRVGGDNLKCSAIARFLETSNQEWLLVFPKDWDRLNFPDLPTKYRPDFPETLEDAYNLKFLTDGFDAYRTALGVQGNNPVEFLINELSTNHQILAHAPAEPLPDSTGFIAADRTPSQQVRELLVEWLDNPERATVSLHLDPLVAPFGEDPQVFADWLLQELRPHWPNNGETTRLGMAPVIVPVPLAGMVEKGDIPDRTLSDRLAEAIKSRFEEDEKITPTSDQMAIALRKPGKLVLLVYPPKSLKWWKMLTEDEEKWNEILRQLCSLASPVPEDRFQRQIVVPICSDLHHQYRLRHQYRWFGKPTS